MLSAFSNSLKIPELRDRILFTLGIIVIVRIGVAITLPGVNPDVLNEWTKIRTEAEGGAAAMAALLNVFSGGGLENCAIFALGIMPYISASIMMQLLTAVVPKMNKLSREEGGRAKITQYTRYATIVLCFFQGIMLANALQNSGEANVLLPDLSTVVAEHGALVPDPGFGFMFVAVTTITAGCVLLMWMGEQITERGIGNGISLIIAVNIVSALPGSMVILYRSFLGENASPMNAVILVILLTFLIFVIAAVITLTQGQRRIAIHYAKRVVGRKVYGGSTQYLPLKVNYAGVMPIIFAQAILIFPTTILAGLFPASDFVNSLARVVSGGWMYYAVNALLIFFFSYFWVATMFQPNQIADDLKKSGGYIPGVRPGKPTAEFLDYTMSRLTLAGAVFLTIVALLPYFISGRLGVHPVPAQFFGGTSLLIMVGVLLDIMRQVETHLLQRHYDGFLRKGRVRGRYERPRAGSITASRETLLYMWVGIAVIAIVGVAYMLYRQTL